MTAVGGMLLLAQGNGDSTSIVPDSPAHWMGAIATTLSFVNIVGGFLITGKMLNLFRRKEDPDDFFGYYAVPAALLVGGLGGSYLLSAENFDSMSGSVGIAAAICCISASKLSSLCEHDALLIYTCPDPKLKRRTRHCRPSRNRHNTPPPLSPPSPSCFSRSCKSRRPEKRSHREYPRRRWRDLRPRRYGG